MAGTLIATNVPSIDDRHFEMLRAALPGGEIYNQSPTALPYTVKTVRIEGQVASGSFPVTVSIYRNDALQSTVSTDAAGAFVIGVRLARGSNKIHATLADGTMIGVPVFIDAYTWGTIFSAYAGVLTEFRDTLDQVLQDRYLYDGVDLDGNAIQSTDIGLRDNFGQYVGGRRLVGSTRVEYQTFLANLLEASRIATSIGALDIIALVYLGFVPSWVFLRETSYAFPAGGGVKFYPRTYPGFLLDYTEWEFWLANHWYKLPGGTLTLEADSQYWVYVDGDVIQYNELELKVMPIVSVASDYPFREETARTVVIPEAEIQVDTAGTRTGVPGTLFVMVDRPITTLTSVAGATYGALADAAVVPGAACWINLGVQFQATDIGDVTVEFTFMKNAVILARVTTDGSGIVAVEFDGRMRAMTGADGTTSGVWLADYTSLSNEMIGIFPNYQLLIPAEKADFDKLLRQVKPSHKLILMGANFVRPSPRFPGPISVELGATLRCQEPQLGVISTELGATRRAHLPPSPRVSDSLFAEMGGCNRDYVG